MSRYDFEEVELDEGNQILDSSYRRFAIRHDDQPRRLPIRRKNNLRLNEEMRPKAKRNHKKIHASLADIEDGVYGICDDCGRDISIKRLNARPVARRCIRCKTRQERRERILGIG